MFIYNFKKIKHGIWLLLILAISCKEPNNTKPTSPVSKVTEAKGYIVPSDSVSAPKVITIDERKLKKIPVGKPKVVQTNLNVHPVGIPKVVPVGKPRVITPGADTFSLPKVVPATAKPFIAKQPQPVPALPFRMKDDATYNIQYLDVDQGMNSSYVSSIIIDKRGNLWFGTYNGGLSKYDGRSFTHYTTNEGLSTNIVTTVLEDKDENIWIGSNNGIIKYDGNTFIHYTEKEGLSNNHINSIIEDKNGNIWIGTLGGGINKYNGSAFTHYTEEEGLNSNYITCIIEDTHGNIWIGTISEGLCKYDGNTFTHYTKKEGLSDNNINTIVEDKNGHLWIGTNTGGVNKYDGYSFTHYTEREGLSDNSITSIIEDKSGNIWFTTKDGGVNKYDFTTFTYYSNQEGLSSYNVTSIIEDESGNLWIGTRGGGVNKYCKNSFVHYIIGNTSSIIEDKNENLWLGLYNGGLRKYDGKYFTHYTEKEGLRSNIITSIKQDKNGNIWLGSYVGGVNKYDGKSFTYYTTKDGLCSDKIVSITEDKYGNIWFGTAGEGISKYDGKSFTNYTKKEGLSNNYISSIIEDKSGNIWIGTLGGGVNKYDGKTFTHYSEINELTNNYISSMIEDKKGNVWIATNGGGVSKYDGKKFTHYTENEGLSNNSIWSIIQDKSGNIWIGTEKGLNCIVTKEIDNLHPQIIKFNKYDGLKAEDFLQNSVLVDSKNHIWWGGGKALSMLDLNKFKLNEKKPEIQLENIYLQENFVDYRNINSEINDSITTNEKSELKKIKFSSVADFHNYPIGLELPYYLNHLTFQFTAIDWYASHKIKYQYKLEGLDTDWSNLTSDNKADYRNIPFGNYTFKVKAIGSANKWSKTFEYPFVIHPPWWRTWWAYTLYVLLAIATLILVVLWNGRRLRAKSIELKNKVDEATLKIKKQKHLIEEKHQEITDSVNYAERIQKNFLVTKNFLNTHLKTGFVLFNPKDKVSGDFYWAEKLNNENIVVMVADSTGHGIPGAFMSLLNMSLLNEAVLSKNYTNTHDILNFVREKLISTIKKDEYGEGGNDGMDGCLFSINYNTLELQFTGANNNLWIIRGNELIELKGEKMPVGRSTQIIH